MLLSLPTLALLAYSSGGVADRTSETGAPAPQSCDAIGVCGVADPSDPRFELHLSPSNHFAFCGWQVQGTAQKHWDERCGAETDTGKICTLRELIQRAYCVGQYQSLGNYPR